MEKEIGNNGFEYVDLGLPSGTLWATCNVGTSKPSDYGLYFQWGDTVGYSADQVGTGTEQKEFSWTDYKFSKDRNGSKFSKYKTNGETLDLEDDAAHVHMGGDWHMPTIKQIKELIDNTTSEWIEQDGVNGRLFTSKFDESKFIFIPAAGDVWSTYVDDCGINGYVWSSMLSAETINGCQYLDIDSVGGYLVGDGRYNGFSVRGVIG